MAESHSVRRCAASLIAIVVLAALAFVTPVGPSASAGAASGTVDRLGVSPPPALVGSHHVLSKRSAVAVRSAGPFSAKLFASRKTVGRTSREHAPASFPPPDYAHLSGYDATAPPRMLLS